MPTPLTDPLPDADLYPPDEWTFDTIVGTDVQDLLTPIRDEVVGIELVAIKDMTYGAIFQLTGTTPISDVVAQLDTLRRERRIHSTGMLVAVLPPDTPVDADPSPYHHAVILLKVENWMIGCIPNSVAKQDNTESYIANREAEMSAELRDYLDETATIHVDGHREGGSLREHYGQYHFLASYPDHTVSVTQETLDTFERGATDE